MKPWEQLLKLTAPHLAEFKLAARDPFGTQVNVLEQILKTNANTRFGLEHGFADIKTVDQFRAKVPVADYERFRPYVEDMVKDKSGVLVAEEPVAFDLTSGSAGQSKIIPYTPTGIKAFRTALFAWLCDLARNQEGITNGRFYWALSPATGKGNFTPGGIPVGPVSDGVFFGPEAGASLQALSCIPADLALEENNETWRTRTLGHLLNATDLSLLSIWSPTFLIALLEQLQQNPERYLKALHDGLSGLSANPARSRFLEKHVGREVLDTGLIWPQLAVISTWTDAGAKRFVRPLQELFSHVTIEGKGLMSTEAIVTIPMSGAGHPVLAINSGFYEFLDVGGGAFVCNELSPGEKYRVVVTTPGGLYRYDTGDQVLVHQAFGGLPSLEFVGRVDNVSDLCGEKLSETFLQEYLGESGMFVMVVPLAIPHPCYALVLDADETNFDQGVKQAGIVEKALNANPHYAHARRVGQLGKLLPVRIKQPLQRYLELAGLTSPRLGSIKPPLLNVRDDWHSILKNWKCK